MVVSQKTYLGQDDYVPSWIEAVVATRIERESPVPLLMAAGSCSFALGFFLGSRFLAQSKYRPALDAFPLVGFSSHR